MGCVRWASSGLLYVVFDRWSCCGRGRALSPPEPPRRPRPESAAPSLLHQGVAAAAPAAADGAAGVGRKEAFVQGAFWVAGASQALPLLSLVACQGDLCGSLLAEPGLGTVLPPAPAMSKIAEILLLPFGL